MNSDQLIKMLKAEKRRDIEFVIRRFDWSSYGMNEIQFYLDDDPNHQDWIKDLSAQISDGLGF